MQEFLTISECRLRALRWNFTTGCSVTITSSLIDPRLNLYHRACLIMETDPLFEKLRLFIHITHTHTDRYIYTCINERLVISDKLKLLFLRLTETRDMNSYSSSMFLSKLGYAIYSQFPF
jgi:hypothetical protein